MTRSKLPNFSRVLAIGIIAMLTFVAAATQKQVHPETGQGGPIVIAVVADHYTAAQEGEFDQDVANFFKYGLLEDPDFYKARGGDFRIETFFEAVAGAEVSKYDFTVGSGASDCAVQWSPLTTGKLVDLTKGIAPEHIVVIGNYPYNFGCADGEWTYVALDAVGTDVLQHEFGHALGELYDEWAPIPGKTGTPQDIQDVIDAKLNCADTAANAPWFGMPGVTNPPGCALYSHLIHAFDHCRMGATHHEMFCAVCRKHMSDAFDHLKDPNRRNPDVTNPEVQNPTQAGLLPHGGFRIVNAAFVEQPVSPPGAEPIFQLLVSFNPATGALSAKNGYFTTARYIPRHRRASGRFVYEFSEGPTVLEVGVLSQQLFTTRSYQGGAQQHKVSDPHAADVLLQLRGLVEKDVMSRTLTLKIYRLAPTVTQRIITPLVLRSLKDNKQASEVATLNTDNIRSVL